MVATFNNEVDRMIRKRRINKKKKVSDIERTRRKEKPSHKPALTN